MLPNIQNDEENILTSDFHKAYTKALSEKAFIKGHTGEILSLSQIMIDRSGLSSIIGNELFCEIVNDQKALPCDEKDADILYRLLNCVKVSVHSTRSSPIFENKNLFHTFLK